MGAKPEPVTVTDETEVVTFGCRLNAYESEVIKQHAASAGLKNALIINSCAVTSEAERQTRQAIRKLRRQHPQAKIIVTGCAAQIRPQQYAQMPEVDLVLGNEEKLRAASYTGISHSARGESSLSPKDAAPKIRVNDIMAVRETAAHPVNSFSGKTRAFVQVQNGCDHRCTFCVIPYGRGNSRSVPMGEIVKQVRLLVEEQGYREIVLSGVDISSYGQDLPGQPTLGQMMRRLLALVPELPRLRLSSIDAVEIDKDLCRLLAEEPRLMPHLHISLQSGDDMILKRMKRRHNRQDIVDFCHYMRRLRPDIVFGADIIAGFPTETEEMFANTLDLVQEVGLLWLHIFPYSPRAGTPAAKMPQLPVAVRKQRAALLRAEGEKQVRNYLAAQRGKKVSVLIETGYSGHNEQFAPVITTKKHSPGSIVNSVVSGHKDMKLIVD